MKGLLSIALAGACFAALASASNAEAQKAYEAAQVALTEFKTRSVNLTAAVNAWDGTSLSDALNNIHYPTLSAISYIENVTTEFETYSTTLDNTQSFKIGTPAQRLSYALNETVATIIGRKTELVSLGTTSILMSDFESLLNASDAFATALINLLPSTFTTIGNNLIGQSISSLEEGIDCFNGTTADCITTIVNPNRTYDLAVKYNAMKADGSPYLT